MTALPISGSELEPYRNLKKLTQAELGEKLGVSGSTVNRWEKEEQAIPGPAQLLLRMLIHGEVPFGERDPQAEAMELAHFWNLRLSLADWHKLEALAAAGGFATVRDYLLSLIQQHLNTEPIHGRSMTAEHGAVDEMALVSEGGDAVGGHLDAAASAFAKENPLPAAGEAGGIAGTTAGRKDVRYTRPPGLKGTGAGKRK